VAFSVIFVHFVFAPKNHISFLQSCAFGFAVITPQWIHFSGTFFLFLGQDIASHPIIPHHLCPFCRLVRAPSKMRLTFSQMRLAFSKMQGAFPPTASRIFENARRIFSDSPCFAILANWIYI